MRYRVLAAVGLLSFGAGFIADRYSGSGMAVGTRAGSPGSSPVAAAAGCRGAAPQDVGLFAGSASRASSVAASGPAASAEPLAKVHPVPSRDRSRVAPAQLPLPPQFHLSDQEQADLAAQHWEARQASIEQVGATIRSLEQAGDPQEQVAHLRELRQGLEAQPNEDARSAQSDPPERTEEELRDDLAASLEQSGLPIAALDEMRQSLWAAPLPVDEPADDPGTDLDPPDGPTQ